ncbi:Dual specificity tyrosine-phosphorylation-regulated kinase 3 [Cichlidogyrus casuarinus]|uniref:Dual specificity tyrosine-phosphorylation-regulated kinase 3 n=1 Tax=Cichlidogyrus casuarinus TaxID=1844966 RepID=A0ABD2QA84_9PLAT
MGLGAQKRYPEGTLLSNVVSRSEDPQKLIGFDDDQSGYIGIHHDHVAFRYELLGLLGKGSFGQVLRAFDHKTGKEVALKVIRSELRFTKQAKEEIRILEELKKQDLNDDNNVIHMLDHFTFRGHVCMTFELLSINLYELIHRNRFKGFSPTLVRKFSYGILISLSLLKK